MDRKYFSKDLLVALMTFLPIPAAFLHRDVGMKWWRDMSIFPQVVPGGFAWCSSALPAPEGSAAHGAAGCPKAKWKERFWGNLFVFVGF